MDGLLPRLHFVKGDGNDAHSIPASAANHLSRVTMMHCQLHFHHMLRLTLLKMSTMIEISDESLQHSS